MAGLDDLRKALLSERETGKLLPVSADFFDRARDALREIRDRVAASEDPFSDDVQTMILETKSIEQTLQDLVAIRTGKILSLAESRAEGQYIDREEIRRMIPAEQEMFDRIAEAIAACQAGLVAGGPGRHAPGDPGQAALPPPAPEAAAVREEEGRKTLPAGPAPVYSLVRVLADLDPFMGVDGMTYALEKGDIVMLPGRNADVLVERNIALNINVGK